MTLGDLGHPPLGVDGSRGVGRVMRTAHRAERESVLRVFGVQRVCARSTERIIVCVSMCETVKETVKERMFVHVCERVSARVLNGVVF